MSESRFVEADPMNTENEGITSIGRNNNNNDLIQTHPAESSNSSAATTRPILPALAIPAHLRPTPGPSSTHTVPSTEAAPSALTPTSPTSARTPTSPRRRAHTVAVSLRPRSGSNASTSVRPSSAAISGSAHQRGETVDEEASIEADGRPSEDGPTGRKRGNSIVDRLRSTTVGSGTRARSRSNASARGPVGYEVLHSGSNQGGRGSQEEEELGDEVVGVLDCIDSEVSTVNHLQNVTNSILVPHLPALWSRRPEVRLGNDKPEHIEPRIAEPDGGPHTTSTGRTRASTVAGLYPASTTLRRPPLPSTTSHQVPVADAPIALTSPSYPPQTSHTSTSTESLKPRLRRSSSSSDHSLDNHVRRVLHETKRQKAKKALAGLWVFLKTPMGVITAIYGVLVVFWGAAIIFFLAGWIPTADKWWQDRWVEISSQIVNGLFTITGVGLIPWRVMDTYRISVIWTLREKTHRLRKKRGLPPIEDPNDIEDPQDQEDYVSVLTEKERAQLKYQQEMFAKSQTWYRPHATSTHRAFPMSWALWNTILMDLNSAFQCILCGTMWGLSQYKRPAWTTGCLIPLSFLCGIGAGILIWQGSARTKKRETVEDKLRKALGVPLAIAVPQQVQDTKLLEPIKKKPETTIIEEGEESLSQSRP